MTRTPRPAARLLGATALILSFATTATRAQGVEGCGLERGVLPPDCVQAAPGTVRARPAQPNVEPATAAGPVGDLGFSISIDSIAVAGDSVDFWG